MQAQDRLQEGIPTAAFAFRGYNVTNLGRTPELLAHASYGPTVASVLGEASRTCSEILGRPVDLVGRVRMSKETTDLTSYAEDVALIVAVEVAQATYTGEAVNGSTWTWPVSGSVNVTGLGSTATVACMNRSNVVVAPRPK